VAAAAWNSELLIALMLTSVISLIILSIRPCAVQKGTCTVFAFHGLSIARLLNKWLWVAQGA
jgi:hypothetical protein